MSIYISYLNELEENDSTDTQKYVSYLEHHIEIDYRGRLRIKLYDKRDDFSNSEFTNHQ